MAQKGGIKLRRSGKHSGMYIAQRSRTKANKIRRLKRRIAFDPSAARRIKELSATPVTR